MPCGGTTFREKDRPRLPYVAQAPKMRTFLARSNSEAVRDIDLTRWNVRYGSANAGSCQSASDPVADKRDVFRGVA